MKSTQKDLHIRLFRINLSLGNTPMYTGNIQQSSRHVLRIQASIIIAYMKIGTVEQRQSFVTPPSLSTKCLRPFTSFKNRLAKSHRCLFQRFLLNRISPKSRTRLLRLSAFFASTRNRVMNQSCRRQHNLSTIIDNYYPTESRVMSPVSRGFRPLSRQDSRGQLSERRGTTQSSSYELVD